MKYDIQFSKNSENDQNNVACFNIQLRNASTESWELAGQNYRLYYDASKAEFINGTSLLGVAYQSFTLIQHVHMIDASSVTGNLIFDQHLGFLNFSLDLLDPSKSGQLLPIGEVWVDVAQICFEFTENTTETCPDFNIVWAKMGKTGEYATSFVEIAALTGVDQTEMAFGEKDIDHYDTCNSSELKLKTKAFLQGAFKEESDLIMGDKLRQSGLIPLVEPYSRLSSFSKDLLFQRTNGGETTDELVLQVEGENAIVDWVLIELRAAQDATDIITSRAALLQRDGDIVEVDGVSEVAFTAPYGAYFIGLRHRNHLGIMTKEPVFLGDTKNEVDFSLESTPLFGDHACRLVAGKRMLWGGNADGNQYIIYQGGGVGNPDVNAVFYEVLSNENNINSSLNYIVFGYFTTDINMDGEVRYQGVNNDVGNIIFYNILSHPFNINYFTNFYISEQIPEREK